MSSFQNSINQLVGSASYYTSINPSLREAKAEREKQKARSEAAAEALNKRVKTAEIATKATESIDAANKVAENELIKDPDVRAAFHDREHGKEKLKDVFTEGNARKQVRIDALKNKEKAYGELFKFSPSEQTYSDYQGAQKARMEFEQRAGQGTKQLQEFFDFWDELDNAIGRQTYYEAYKYFDESTPVGGAK
jgi:hypothetical protein